MNTEDFFGIEAAFLPLTSDRYQLDETGAGSGGKAAAVDYNILAEGCKPSSKALKLAKKSRIKNGYGTRKVPKIKI